MPLDPAYQAGLARHETGHETGKTTIDTKKQLCNGATKIMAVQRVSNAIQGYHKLGIMGGTFDPIHCGHLSIAKSVRALFNLEKVIFVPSHCPPHKSITEIVPVMHRFAMVQLAIAEYSYFEASRIEIDRDCPTYAGDTIEEIKKIYANGELYFITGLDALLTILDRDRSKTYPGICQFIAAARPGYDTEKIKKDIPEEFLPYVFIVEDLSETISSTAVRSKIRADEPIDHMVPLTLIDYIKKWNLYKNSLTYSDLY
jgi:nicotinate-nucleotide adenylyltransferase